MMNQPAIAEFNNWLENGQLSSDFALCSLNTWHIGGNAEYFFRPNSVEDLGTFLSAWQHQCAGEPVRFLGLGSNLLIPDQGVKGVVVSTLKGLTQLQQLENGTIYAEAGVPCAKLAKFCVKLGLNGGFFAGIPGTVGGALVMNAGAFGSETWQHVIGLDQILPNGTTHYVSAKVCHASYRRVEGLSAGWVTGGYFQFDSVGDPIAAKNIIKDLLYRRQQTQPIGTFNCGSVFLNPPGHHAAKLIETAGLKGQQIGNAVVSPKHANFIVNLGHATSEEVLTLVKAIQEKVWAIHGVQLQPEFRVW